MPHDAEFWKTAGETGGVLGTVLTPFALAVFGAVKRYRKEHAEEEAEGTAKPGPFADLKEAVARLEHENARLCEQVERANDRADKADARAERLQEFVDARGDARPRE